MTLAISQSDKSVSEQMGMKEGSVRSLEIQDITPMEEILFDKEGNFQIVFSEVYKQFNQSMISQFCVKHAMYCLPTTELIDWLKDRVEGKKAIEVGAGCGVVGRAVGIPMTDNHQQAMRKYKTLYNLVQQPPIKYGKDVLKVDAVEAVKRFKPDVVVGCWVTHKYNPKRHESGGNEVGLDEYKIIKRVSEYIVVGNDSVHEQKLIMDQPHETLRPDWLISRGFDSDRNAIYIWKK